MERQAIRGQLETLLRAWQSGEVDLLDSCVAEECKAYFSTHWNVYVRTDLKFQLQHTGKERSVSRMEIIGESARVQGDSAAQSATVIGCFGDGNSSICFGGTFNNRLQKVNGTWWLTELHFELQTDNSVKDYQLDGQGHVHREAGTGDTAFIEKWKQVNTAIGLFVDQDEAQGRHTITAEFDAPYYLLPDAAPADDEAAINEVFQRYGYAVDFYCPDLLASAIAEDAEVQFGAGRLLNGRDAVNFLTIIRQASARSFHALKLTAVNIQGDRAEAQAIRLMPEKADGAGTDENALLAGRYELGFVKNGKGWQISRLHYAAV